MRTATAGRGPPLAEAAVEEARRASTRYLRYLAGLVFLLGIFERSDLLSPHGVALLVVGIGVFRGPGPGGDMGQVDSEV